MNVKKLFALSLSRLVPPFAIRFLNNIQSKQLKQILVNNAPDSVKNESSWFDHKIIAHATGAVGNKVYTNSIEAFEENYRKGSRLFEIDVLLSSNNKIIVAHDLNRKYVSSLLTQLDFLSLAKLMKKYPNTFVIIDGKTTSNDDTLALYKHISKETKNFDRDILRRFIPQMFYEKDLNIIREYGFYDVLYAVGREDFTYLSIADYCKENKIKAITFPKRLLNKEFVDVLAKNDILVYAYVLNRPKEIQECFEIGVHGFLAILFHLEINYMNFIKKNYQFA